MNPIVRLAAFVALGATVIIVPVSTARAADNLIPGKIHIIKDTKLTKMVAKPVGPLFSLPTAGGAGDPTLFGGSLTVTDLGDSIGFATPLPTQPAPMGWKGLGNPAGSTGYKYKGAGTLVDPCKIVLVKESVIKFVCKDDQLLNPPLAGNSGIVLALGNENYCAEFGGTEIKNVAGLFKHKDAPPPAACSFATTTTSTSSTTTSTFGPCCGGFGYGVYTSGAASGTCGTIKDFNGGTYGSVACGGLYFGGAENAVPLPAITPDLGQTVVKFTSCAVQTATVGPTTSTQTGTDRNCSSPGCFFGGPLPIPNTSSTPTSTCVINSVKTAVSGSVDCGLGTQNVSLPLDSEIFLTGDTATDPSDTIPGIQPCPICSGGTCIGGPNDTLPCVADDTNQGSLVQYPTSHHCPPDPMFTIGTIPINLALTTGAVSWTGTVATNDTGNTVSNQSRVFCGYCRDKNGTGAFAQPFEQCWEAGATFGSACTEPFESCEQRDHGAYGPGGGAVKTITIEGTPAGNVFDGASHAQKLVTNFCIPPTFNPTVDASADLPGPGTLALTGVTELCTAPSPCPGP